MDYRDIKLDWVGRFDPESKKYPVGPSIRRSVRRRNKTWTIGPILNQGREGACVGFGWTAEALSTPIKVQLRHVAADVPREPNQFAQFIYKDAQKDDEWAGENYEGTSVLAGAKAMKRVGLLREYRWSFDINDIIDSVLAKGPVVFGSNWYDDMYDTEEDGVMQVSGDLVGGHCYAFVGYRVKPAQLNGEEDALVVQNSWGTGWGNNGLGLMRVSDAARLLEEWGEACVATSRSYGWKIYPPKS
jgi:hypothetical protein